MSDSEQAPREAQDPIYEVVQTSADRPAPRRRFRKGRWAAGILGVALVAGASVVAVEVVGALSGTNSPGVEAELPYDTIAFAQASLDPSAGQKIAAYDIGRKFPQVKNQISKSDPEGSLINYVLKQSGASVTWNEIHSWVGARVGVAAVQRPDAKTPFWLALVQVKNQTKAKADLDRLRQQGDVTYEFRNGYAYIAQTKTEVDTALADLQSHGPLSQQADFKPGAGTVGDGDILGGYANLAAVGKLGSESLSKLLSGLETSSSSGVVFGSPTGVLSTAPDGLSTAPLSAASSAASGAANAEAPALTAALAGLRGIATFHLQLNGGGAELDADSYGTKTAALSSGGDSIEHLPSDSIVALEIHDAASAYSKSLKQFASGETGQINDALRPYGISVPDDLPALFGDDVAASVSDVNDSPAYGAIVHGTQASKGAALLKQAFSRLAAQGTQVPVTVTASGDQYTVASSSSYAAELGSGGLGDTSLFKRAVPKANGATAAGYVNFGSLAKLAGSDDSGLTQASDLVAAVGFSASQSSTTSAHFQLNVVFK